MNLNISEIVNNKLKEMDDNGIVKKAIENTIEKTVISSITDALSSYQFQNNIEEKVTKEISGVVADIDLTTYNSFIVSKIKGMTEGICREDLCQKLEVMFSDIFICKKENIKLSEIFEKYREIACEGVEEIDKYDRKRFHLKYAVDEKYGWIDCELAEDGNYRSEMIKFTVCKKYKDKTTGWINAVYIDGHNVENSLVFRKMNKVELMLVQAVYNKTPIIIDIEDENDLDDSYDVDY